MKLLLDTHSFLWWHGERTKLPPSVLTLCEDAANDLYLSIASIWEIQIKLQLDKLKLSYPLSEIIEREQRGNAVKILHILPSHIYQLAKLPSHHRDPLDRILITQAQVEAATLLTQDALITQYPVNTLW